MKKLFYLTALTVSIFTISSCSKDDSPAIFPLPINEEEVITTVTTTLTNGTNVITLSSRDLDGDGPNTPVINVSGNLALNTTYTGSVTFLNEIANPIGDITSEVLAEAADHQLFFQAPTTLGTFTYSDTDINGYPIGLSFSLTTAAAASNGNLTVTLRHQPLKSAIGVASGSITNAGGDTDAEVVYPIVVQ